MDIVAEVRRLGLPEGEYVVCGSAVMAIRGIRDAADINLVVTERVYAWLKEKGWTERFWDTGRPKEVRHGPFDAGTAWSVGDYRPDLRRLIDEAEVIDGVPFVRLEELIAWKRAGGRPKDTEDLILIDRFLADPTAPSRRP